jgi:4-hydroxy-2-oxoheptanedioate aldolase
MRKPGTDNEMHESVHAIASVGVSPIVRIPANEGWMVKRALDAGAHGIIVPLLYSVEDAQKLVQSAKFPPVGKRGFGSPFSMGAFDIKGDLSGFDYMKNANDHLLTIVQIETKEALDVVSKRCRPNMLPARNMENANSVSCKTGRRNCKGPWH